VVACPPSRNGVWENCLVKRQNPRPHPIFPKGGRGFAASLIYQTGDGRFKDLFLLCRGAGSFVEAALPFDPILSRDVDVVGPLELQTRPHVCLADLGVEGREEVLATLTIRNDFCHGIPSCLKHGQAIRCLCRTSSECSRSVPRSKAACRRRLSRGCSWKSGSASPGSLPGPAARAPPSPEW